MWKVRISCFCKWPHAAYCPTHHKLASFDFVNKFSQYHLYPILVEMVQCIPRPVCSSWVPGMTSFPASLAGVGVFGFYPCNVGERSKPPSVWLLNVLCDPSALSSRLAMCSRWRFLGPSLERSCQGSGLTPDHARDAPSFARALFSLDGLLLANCTHRSFTWSQVQQFKGVEYLEKGILYEMPSSEHRMVVFCPFWKQKIVW